MKKRSTYSGDPSVSPRDAVRFHLGDTDQEHPLLDDREVDFALSKQGSELLAAATLAEHLQGVFARKAKVTVGPISKDFSSVSKAYADKAKQLRQEHGILAGVCFPAVYVNDREAMECNTSLTSPDADVGQFDNPRAYTPGTKGGN